MRTIAFLGSTLAFLLFHRQSGWAAPATVFNTGGHTVYHLQAATVDAGGRRAVVSAAYDGMVQCHAVDGTLLWQSPTGGFFPFDLGVGDSDGDGFDEAFVASADGTLYAFDHDGKALWKFAKEPPLYQVCVARSKSGAATILTGGIERILYALSAQGEVLRSAPFEHLIRDIRAGDFLGDGNDYAAVVTANNGREGFRLHLLDPEGLKPVWQEPIDLTDREKGGSRIRVFSLVPMDVNADGAEEMVMSVSTGTSADLAAYTGRGERLTMKPCKGSNRRPYRMNLLAAVKSPTLHDEFILGLFGSELIVYSLDGSNRSVHLSSNAFSNIAFDPKTNSCLLGSDIAGDDGITILHLDGEGWQKAFESAGPIGRLAQVRRNLEVLADQAQAFSAPPYQPAARGALAIVQQKPDEVDRMYKQERSYRHLQFASYVHYTERYESGIENPKWRKEFEQRHSGDVTPREEILAEARRMEAAGQDFVVWAGHGRIFGIDFYISLETIEELLKAAPKTLQGFVFAELENYNEPAKKAVLTQLAPMAQMCLQYGKKKVLLRNKNIFWNGSCCHDAWKETLLGGKWREIFVPSMEETNCRTQEISLSGRVGLWMTNRFERHSARVVTDNATYSRNWEWGQQQTISHFLRSLALQASLGADILHINLYGSRYEDLLPLFELLEKGALWVPRREEILSISPVCLGMRDPSESYLEHGTNGHAESAWRPSAGPSAFDRLDCYWGGAPIPEHDFSYYAFGSRARMLNFLPKFPYGLVCMIPDETDLAQCPPFQRKITTDGEFFYDEEGRKRLAPDYKPVVEQALAQAAEGLPLRVEGDVAWSAARLDSTHVRVTLLDSGYIDPADRSAEIVLQRLEGLSCRDILSGEELPIREERIALTVPAGVFRILDIEHKP